MYTNVFSCLLEKQADGITSNIHRFYERIMTGDNLLQLRKKLRDFEWTHIMTTLFLLFIMSMLSIKHIFRYVSDELRITFQARMPSDKCYAWMLHLIRKVYTFYCCTSTRTWYMYNKHWFWHVIKINLNNSSGNQAEIVRKNRTKIDSKKISLNLGAQLLVVIDSPQLMLMVYSPIPIYC